jgi:hypothetical protein
MQKLLASPNETPRLVRDVRALRYVPLRSLLGKFTAAMRTRYAIIKLSRRRNKSRRCNPRLLGGCERTVVPHLRPKLLTSLSPIQLLRRGRVPTVIALLLARRSATHSRRIELFQFIRLSLRSCVKSFPLRLEDLFANLGMLL